MPFSKPTRSDDAGATRPHGVPAARLYCETQADFFDAKNITIPFAISVFPDELYQAPRG